MRWDRSKPLIRNDILGPVARLFQTNQMGNDANPRFSESTEKRGARLATGLGTQPADPGRLRHRQSLQGVTRFETQPADPRRS
jgi:hypothetical protein